MTSPPTKKPTWKEWVLVVSVITASGAFGIFMATDLPGSDAARVLFNLVQLVLLVGTVVVLSLYLLLAFRRRLRREHR